jgi:hypothetical protein
MANKSGSGLRFSDFFAAIPRALPGLGIGFVLFLIFGLIASLTSAHPITNTFIKIAVLCLFGCTLWGYITALKELPAERRRRAEQRAAAQRFERQLADAFNALNNANCSTEEGIKRYADACDFLIWACSAYHAIPEYNNIVSKYRHLCYQRTYPVYKWINGAYQYVPGTELAEEVQKEFYRLTVERESHFR